MRAYDIGSLVGDVGGYIGLFLGYALLNLPQFLRLLFDFGKDRVSMTKHPKSSISIGRLRAIVPKN